MRRRMLTALMLALVLFVCACGRKPVEEARQYGIGGECYPMASYMASQFLFLEKEGTRVMGAGLNPQAKLLPGYKLHLAHAVYPYFDAEKKEARAEAYLAYAEREGLFSLSESQASRLLENALKSGIVDGYAEGWRAQQALKDAFKNHQAQGWIGTDGVARPGTASFKGDFVLDGGQQAKLADHVRTEALKDAEARGLKQVSDERALGEAAVETGIADELLRKYAGQPTLVLFRDGSLWAIYDGAPLGSCWKRREGEDQYVLMDADCALVTFTKAAPSELLKALDLLMESCYIEQDVSADALLEEIVSRLSKEYGVQDREGLKNALHLSVVED